LHKFKFNKKYFFLILPNSKISFHQRIKEGCWSIYYF
jgi:hypothetical protein